MTSPPADSAGVPWQGRSFGEHPSSADDGSAPSQLMVVLERFRAGGCSTLDVIEAIRVSRLLIPLVAELVVAVNSDAENPDAENPAAEHLGAGHRGRNGDKSADLGIVTVAAPDGRRVLPVFSSVDAMTVWNPDARPVPSDAVRVGLAAASEGTELVVLDPGSVSEFVIRRPAVWALAQSLPWVPSFLDDEVLAAILAAAAPEASVAAVLLDAGDPSARLAGPELDVAVAIHPGLARAELEAVLRRLSDRIAADEVIAARVDSLAIRVIDATSLDRAKA